MSVGGSMYGSLLNESLSRETRDVLELGLAALAFGTPAASEAGSVYGSMRGGHSMYGSMYGGSISGTTVLKPSPSPAVIKPSPSPAVQRASEEQTRRSEAPPAHGHGRDAENTPAYAVDERTAPPAYVPRRDSPPPTVSDLKRAVKDDVAALVNEIMGSGHQPQQSPAIQSRPVQAVAQSPNRLQLPSDADISPEEALERERIRREIQEKMTAMRKQMNEEKAAPSPAPPAVQSPVLTKILTPKEPTVMAEQPSSAGSATSKDGDAFWKALLNDLKLVDDDAVLRDVKGHLQLQDLDEPYHSRGRRSAPHSADRSSMLDGSYPSSLISSRSPSPSALDNPVSLAAKRETLLGASLNSEYGSMRGLSLRNSNSSIDGFDRRRPDLGSDWQRDLDAMGSHVLGKLENPQHKWIGTQATASPSHTETLLQNLQHDKPLQMQRSAPPPATQMQTQTKINKTQAPGNLNVRCKVDSAGATLYATWEALWEVWGLSRDSGLAYEVQMIVRWISGQTWNTIYTVTEPTCTVKGLKPNCPFAVRVRAVTGNWSSDYTMPFEFVTEEAQVYEQNAQTFQSSPLKQAEQKPVSDLTPETMSFYPPQMSYLERVMQARQEQAEREAAKNAADKAAAERAAAERAVVEKAAREYRDQQLLVERQNEANVVQASKVRVQRAAARADTSSEGLSDYARLSPSKITVPMSTSRASNERVTTGSDGKQRVVMRISLSDPNNPHYAKYQQQMAAQSAAQAQAAEQPVQRQVQEVQAVQARGAEQAKAAEPQVQHQIQGTEGSQLYGSIYRARRATPDNSTTTTTILPSTQIPSDLYGSNRDMYGSDRRAVHTSPLVYHTKPATDSTSDLGPLARAFGVSSYVRGEAPQEARRVVANHVSSTTTISDVPMVRAYVVNVGGDLRAATPNTLGRRGVA